MIFSGVTDWHLIYWLKPGVPRCARQAELVAGVEALQSRRGREGQLENASGISGYIRPIPGKKRKFWGNRTSWMNRTEWETARVGKSCHVKYKKIPKGTKKNFIFLLGGCHEEGRIKDRNAPHKDAMAGPWRLLYSLDNSSFCIAPTKGNGSAARLRLVVRD
jgi:hypothetical protein